MNDDDLEILTHFRSDVPEPGDETARSVYALATAVRRRRRPRRGRLVLGASVAALVLVPTGFAVDRLLSSEQLGGSTNTTVCTLTNRSGDGRVWVEMAVSPRSLEPQACSDLQQHFGGVPFTLNGKVGTGHVYCRWNDITDTYEKEIGILASDGTTASDFCRTFDPGPGFERYYFHP